MKRILLVCNHFAPDNTIVAVRTSKLAKYLKKAGYEISVLTEKKQEIMQDEILARDTENISVCRVENSKPMQFLQRQYKRIISPFKKKRMKNLYNRVKINPKTGRKEFYSFETAYPILGSLDYLMELIRQYDLFLQAKKFLRGSGQYDYLITSYGDMFSVFFGLYVRKKDRNIKWICDIRDAIYRYKFTPEQVKWIPLSIEKKVWKRADCITAVSKGM